MPKITEMFAFVSYEGGQEEDEGVLVASPDGLRWAPLVGADLSRVKSLIPIADGIKAATGLPYKILKFKLVEEIKPESIN